nr:glycosyltransferase [uncultured Psychroserpens sp.]
MLSVLIPVYNYDIRALVKILHEQLSSHNIDFEINCLDDYSQENYRDLNTEIENLKNTSYQISNANNGRVATRQTLAQQAKYNWLLFLDADVVPKTNNYISNYIALISSEKDAIYGGFAYKPKPPKDHFILRWTYGKSKEQVTAINRNKTPYKIVISANFMIKKEVFLELNSQITQRGYGYDNYFGALLKHKQYRVFHIDNEVYHLGLEANETYLSKIEQSVETLLKLELKKETLDSQNSLFNTYQFLKKIKLNYLFAWFYKVFKNRLKKNLLSAKPNITVLQFYKLSYICYQDLHA